MCENADGSKAPWVTFKRPKRLGSMDRPSRSGIHIHSLCFNEIGLLESVIHEIILR